MGNSAADGRACVGERITPNAPRIEPFGPLVDGAQPILDWDVATALQCPAFQKIGRLAYILIPALQPPGDSP
jgi:hypothetical protein